jgi:hypothetical protein
MRGKNTKKLFLVLSLSLMWIVSNSLVYPTVSSFDSTFFSYGQDINSTESNGLFFGINNATGLSLIPLMIKEMENTNATAIPIKQVINATPSNATALQSISKNSTVNNNTNAADTTGGFNSVNDTAQELIPLVVNLTENTNATDIAMDRTINASDIAMDRTINATPSNITALQNMTGGNTNASDISDDFKSVNDTAQELIPLVVNLTENTNATAVPIKQVINATPSNATALQNMTGGNTNASDISDDFNSVNDTAQ